MNKHSEIKLPPKPEGYAGSMTTVGGERIPVFAEYQLEAYARAAVEADRAQRDDDAKDAARYRELRSGRSQLGVFERARDPLMPALNPAYVDAVLDESREQPE